MSNRNVRVVPRYLPPSDRTRRGTGGVDVLFAYADDGCPLYGTYFLPAGAGPYQWSAVWHEGGFRNGVRTSGPVITACKALAAAGIAAMTCDYRMTVQKLTGQTSSGCWPQQVDDAKLAIKYLRSRSDCNGIVDAVGASSGGSHAVSVGSEIDGFNWSAGDRARRIVSLSGVYDFTATTPPGPLLTKYQQNIHIYCNSSDMNVLMNYSPDNRMPADTKSMLLRASEEDTIPAPVWDSMIGRIADLGLTADVALLPGTRHGFAYWNDVAPDVIAFLKAA